MIYHADKFNNNFVKLDKENFNVRTYFIEN